MPIVPISQRQAVNAGYKPAVMDAPQVNLAPIAQGMDQAAQLWQKTKDDADNAAAYEASNDAQSQMDTMMWSQDSGLITQRRGKNAIGVADDGLKQFDEWSQARRAKLSNPQQMALYDKLTASPRNGMRHQLLRHQSSEFESLNEGTYKNTINTSNESARLNYNSKDMLDAGLLRVQGANIVRLQQLGIDDPSGGASIKREAVSNYYASAVEGAIANKDIKAARMLLTTHNDAFDEKQKASLLRMLEPEEVAAKGLTKAEEAYAKFGPGKPTEADAWLVDQLKDDTKALDESRRQLRLKGQAYEDGQKITAADVLNHAITTGNYSWASVPLELRKGLSREKEASVKESLMTLQDRRESKAYSREVRADARENREARAILKAKNREALSLYVSLTEDPEKLKTIDLNTHLQDFADGDRLADFKRLRDWQGKLRGDIPGDFEQSKAGRGIVNRYLKPFKTTKFGGKGINDVRDDAYVWMDEQVDSWKAMNPGKTITQDDMEAIAAKGFVRGELTTDAGVPWDSKENAFRFQSDGQPFAPNDGSKPAAPATGKPSAPAKTPKIDPDSLTSVSQIPKADYDALSVSAAAQGLTGKKAEAYTLNLYKAYLRNQ